MFAPEKQRTENKRERQEIGEGGEGEETRGEEEGVFVAEDKGLPPERGDVAHKQMAVYPGKGTLCQDDEFNFNWACELGEPKGA